MKLKRIFKIIMIVCAVVSAFVLAAIMVAPALFIQPEQAAHSNIIQPVAAQQTELQEPAEEEQPQIDSRLMSRMFFSAPLAPPSESEAEIVEQLDRPNYITNRFSYIGTISTDGKPGYFIKDNQINFIFPINEGEANYNLSITEINQQDQSMILSDGESFYWVNLK